VENFRSFLELKNKKTDMAFRIQLRNDTLTNWSEVNPILLQGEPAYENDTDRLKIGNGASGYTSLPYFYGSVESINGLKNSVGITGGEGISVTTGSQISISAVKPYKIYTAYLNSTGSNNPSSLVLESDFGSEILWTRSATGSYLASISGPTSDGGDFGHNINRLMIRPTSSAPSLFLTGQFVSASSLQINQVNFSGTPTDGLDDCFVEVKVY
jgi:hypothetical protein